MNFEQVHPNQINWAQEDAITLIHKDSSNLVAIDEVAFANLLQRVRKQPFKEIKEWLVTAISDCSNRAEVVKLCQSYLNDSQMLDWHDEWIYAKQTKPKNVLPSH